MFMFFFVSLLFPPEAAGESAQSDSDDIIVHSQATGRKVSERPGFVYLLTGLSLLSVQIDLQLVVGRGSGSCCLFLWRSSVGLDLLFISPPLSCSAETYSK